MDDHRYLDKPGDWLDQSIAIGEPSMEHVDVEPAVQRRESSSSSDSADSKDQLRGTAQRDPGCEEVTPGSFVKEPTPVEPTPVEATPGSLVKGPNPVEPTPVEAIDVGTEMAEKKGKKKKTKTPKTNDVKPKVQYVDVIYRLVPVMYKNLH